VTVYCYSAYGLAIHSTLPLPELTATAETGPDVVIRSGKVVLDSAEADPSASHFHIAVGEALFHWDGVGSFLVRHGREIVVDPCAEVEERLLRRPLLGVVLGALLCQRGKLVLHGSTVSANGSAIVFLGSKGAGKSTMAAAFYAQGYRLVTDDVAALDVDGQADPMVLPAFPQLNLWPDAVAASL
jgi:hypothetical protein